MANHYINQAFKQLVWSCDACCLKTNSSFYNTLRGTEMLCVDLCSDACTPEPEGVAVSACRATEEGG